jgi:hypothetical protein
MSLHDLIMLSGLLAAVSLILTMAIGLMIMKFHVRWLNMKWHTIFAVITLIFALTHIGLVYFH